ncbi:MAG TPA: HAD hydrolase-like protein [Trebonia sp.]|jgi:phosphoglycolate phosphatase|nr:HAD hydrolase-like protein [Trebonia sp.]
MTSQTSRADIVGFDLDMTLIDSRGAILASFAAVARETGVAIDPAGVDSRLGIKLEDELIHWFPAREVPAAIEVYRRHYRLLSEPLTTLLPGARESVAAVRAAGARVVVITAKLAATARRALAELDLPVDDLLGDLHGAQKGEALARLAAAAYVGDTPPDMRAAVSAGALAVGVATGSFSAGDLSAAGAQVVLASLEQFPAWYVEYRADYWA